MYAGDEIYPDEVTSGPVPGDSGRTCQVCTTCGVACAKTDDLECWECSTDVGGEG
jgi:hypothetical protein